MHQLNNSHAQAPPDCAAVPTVVSREECGRAYQECFPLTASSAFHSSCGTRRHSGAAVPVSSRLPFLIVLVLLDCQRTRFPDLKPVTVSTFPQSIRVTSMFSLFWQLWAVRVLFSCIRGHLNRNALKLKTFLAVAVNMPVSHFVRRSQTAVRKLQPDVPKPVGVAPMESILR